MMNIREVSNALNEIRAKMSCPEDLMVDTIKDDKVIFENGCTYSLITKERVA